MASTKILHFYKQSCPLPPYAFSCFLKSCIDAVFILYLNDIQMMAFRCGILTAPV